MTNRIKLAGVLGALVVAGVHRAEVDMAIEQEALRNRFADNTKSPTGRLSFPGLPERQDIGNGVYRGTYELGQPERPVGVSPALGAPYDESHAIKITRDNPQADIYASAADLISPLPDRLSVNPESPHYGNYGRIGVRFDGSDRPGDVEEYCVSEGWIRIRTFMANGKPKRERGKFVCLKKYGKVEPYRK